MPNEPTLEALSTYFKLSPNQLLGYEPLKNESLNSVPLLNWGTVIDSLTGGEALNSNEKPVLTDAQVGANSFALLTQDSSMEPLFPSNTTLVFDKDRAPKDRSYVLVLVSQKPLFRQLILDGELKLIKSLNPDITSSSVHKLGDEDRVLAVLTQAKMDYNA